MAEFNPKVDNIGSTNYTNFSERYSGNQAWGTLFEGLAKGADQMVQKNLETKVNSMVNDLDNNVYGMDEVAKGVAGEQPAQPGQSVPGGTPTEKLPTPVADGAKSIEMLKKAKEAGSMSPGNYAAQLYTKVKALKAQYPGYANDIDEMVRSAYNAPSANLLRAQIIEQLQGNKTAADKERENRLKFIQEHSGDLSEADRQDYARTGDVSDEAFAKLRYSVSDNAARDADQDRILKNLQVFEAKRTKDQNDEKVIQASAGSWAKSRQQKIIDNVMKGAGGIDSINALVQQYKEGGLDPTETADLADKVNELTAMIDSERANLFATPIEGSDKTIGQRLTDTDRKQINEDFDWLKGQLKSITGGDEKALSAIGLNATLLQAGKDTDVLKIWNEPGVQVARQIAAYDKSMGGVPGLTQLIIQDDLKSGGKSPVVTSLKAIVAGKTLTEGLSPVETFNKLQNSNSVNPKQIGQTIAFQVNAALTMAKNPQVPEDKRIIAIKAITTNNIGFFDTLSTKTGKDGLTERERVYRQIAQDPEFAKAALELGQKDPDVLMGYKRMLVDGGAAIMKPYADTAQQDIVTLNKYATLRFDEKSKQYTVTVDENKFKDPEKARQFLNYYLSGQTPTNLFLSGTPDVTGLDLVDAKELNRLRNGLEAVKAINIYVKATSPFFEAQGIETQAGVEQSLHALNLSAPKSQPMIDWVLGGFQTDMGYGKSQTGEPSDNYVKVPDLPLEVSPNMMPGNGANGKQSMMLPDGTKIEPAGYKFEGSSGAANIDSSFADHMASPDVPYNKVIGGSKEYNKKVPLLMGKLTSDLGLNSVQAAGLIGNLAHESAELKPHIPGDGGSAHGWAQWNGPRKRDMLKWTKANGYDPNSDDGNYAYLIHDLQENYPKALEHLKKAKTVEEATKIIQNEYEFPGVPVYESRLKYARKALAAAPK